MNHLFTNCHILNLTSRGWDNASLLVENESIKCIGSLQQCKLASSQQPDIIDLKGRLLLPAFTDTHTHFVEYAKGSIQVNLSNCHDLDAIFAYLVNYRKAQVKLPQWILGGGWDRNKLSNPHKLNRHFLDTIFPDIPVALISKDYHSKLCNSLALQLACTSQATPDPPGGHIERDQLGHPTGVLYETAAEIIDCYVVPPDSRLISTAINTCIGEIHTLGLTGFHSMESVASRDLLLQAQRSGKRFRLCWHFMTEDFETAISEGLRSYQGSEWYKPGGLKLFADGSLGSQTAAMYDPYPDGSSGILRYTSSDLYHQMQQAAINGLSCTIHAIGNRCVRQVIDCTLSLNTAFPGLFHRIEHVQSIRPIDISLLKQSGLFAAVQPLHLANDVPMIQQNWHGIQSQAYAFASMLKQDIPLGFGSDAPIESINPFLGIYSAIQRRPQLNLHQPQFQPAETISVLDAIHAYTLGAAMASKSQLHRGSLETGKLADIIVLDDFRTEPDEFWLTARSRLTMINGVIVHSEL